MKASEIEVGGFYIAKVSDKLVTVRVDEIGSQRAIRGTNFYTGGGGKWVDKTVYHVTNTATGRKTVFRSAAKFRSCVASTCRVNQKVTNAGPTQPTEPQGTEAVPSSQET
jgi:hypothetical protein